MKCKRFNVKGFYIENRDKIDRMVVNSETILSSDDKKTIDDIFTSDDGVRDKDFTITYNVSGSFIEFFASCDLVKILIYKAYMPDFIDDPIKYIHYVMGIYYAIGQRYNLNKFIIHNFYEDDIDTIIEQIFTDAGIESDA